MAVTDLTNTTWQFCNDMYMAPSIGTKYINFTSNNKSFSQLLTDEIESDGIITYFEPGDAVYAYNSGWINQAYRTIYITGGTSVTDSTLISWLQQNATQQESTKKYKVGWRVTPATSSYSVTFTASDSWSHQGRGYVKIYDGQDLTGTLLLNQTPANKSAYPITLEVKSGYCAIDVYGPSTMGLWVSSNDYADGPSGLGYFRYTTDKDGTIDISITDFDD